ncbi:MAG: ribosomal protein S18-alanine N-acetyltransferase [Proteobacteria bacterium]|nr:ribosomal protein S18-alanine N-acetyltransferase [Pseudomonadota bacterium]
MATAADLLYPPQLRAMRAEDLSTVAALERAAYRFPWSEAIFRDCLRVGYLCHVAVAQLQVVGYGILSYGAGEAHVLNLCVAEQFRCRGTGRALLLYLLQAARTAGMTEAFLEVRPSNTAAIRLYQSLGFVQAGQRRGYYQTVGGREDAAVLRLALASLQSPGYSIPP